MEQQEESWMFHAYLTEGWDEVFPFPTGEFVPLPVLVRYSFAEKWRADDQHRAEGGLRRMSRQFPTMVVKVNNCGKSHLRRA